MNILRLSIFSLTLAVAVLALGFVNPSFAHKTGEKHNHGGGGGGGDPPATETKYTVKLQADDPGQLFTTNDCKGLNKGSKLSAVFPGEFDNNEFRVGCADFTIDDGGPYDTAVLHLGEIAVTQQNTRVILFFTSDMLGQQFPGNETGYQTPRLAVTATSSMDGKITLTVQDGEMVPLTKSAQPDKRLKVGDIAVASFLYTPVPE